jgi:anti-sigma B factor antagonist
MALEIDKQGGAGSWVLVVRGEVDLYSSPELRNAITKVMPKKGGAVTVDLRGVPYMDSSGVATLVEGYRSALDTGTQFVLAAPSQSVMKVLQLSRLDSVFTIREDT